LIYENYVAAGTEIYYFMAMFSIFYRFMTYAYTLAKPLTMH